MSTPFHAKYYAHDISRRRSAGNIQQLTHSLFDACVDLNPHQIEAALFAIQSPLSQGAILADEVGLGKTIEAGLLLTQYWAERRRRLLIICPASLRKQWSNELREKFHLPNIVLDSRLFTSARDKGLGNLLDKDHVVIVSIHFAGRYSSRLRTIDWDLVIIDEAHKLRNVYRKKNKLAQQIKWALDGRKKILLTATPLQNSLMELYGLASIIDEHYFGDEDSFRKQFVNSSSDHLELRGRLARFCHRTLRNDVTEYIRYTHRRSMTLTYESSDQEQLLYDRVTEFIGREESYSIPKAQRHLMTLVLLRILASSRYAVIGTLKTLRDRLQALRDGHQNESLVEYFLQDDALEDDYFEDYAEEFTSRREKVEIDPEKLNAEIAELSDLIALAESIHGDAKAETLLRALDIGFKELKKMKARRKAIIFTESRRTQEYLAHYLKEKGYKGKIVLFNGGNNDPQSQRIYQDWLEKNRGSGRISGSRAIDIRAAIIEYFRDHADILIATEAAAEGVNLQFCSLLINYDLPWNPQRIEQRIGRVHRYGQQHDVVVINFLNERNAADARVFELLDQKFHLFDGVFGASDEILGAIDSGVDFERRIHRIYQECRHPEQIEEAFNELQREMQKVIESKMNDTKRLLLEHFDADVHSRLKVNLAETRRHLGEIGERFWEVTKYVLTDIADFHPDLEFDLLRSPVEGIKTGRYHLISHDKRDKSSEFLYRLGHPLGEYVIANARHSRLQPAHVYFDITNHPVKITPVSKLRGQSGWMMLKQLTIESFESEEYLLLGGLDACGKWMDQELCDQFFRLRGAVGKAVEPPDNIVATLDAHLDKAAKAHLERSTELNNSYFIQECDKLDRWADDVVAGVEKDLQAIKKQIRSISKQSRLVREPLEQHKLQVELQNLEREKKAMRQRLFEVEDDVSARREELISKMEKRMRHEHRVETLFILRWTVI